ncbi:vacuolar ATPase assembly integral membrane protein VMA21 homolog [Paramacrobiotus metropolitanus]|uniref:vacuolar ATPase assembly integral membrane protein VMA21 homolog n=1 Tax=Paramacrobiotus metropolitanus TaxID=2943436 RepID=UPI0024464861|nr:vacuolar ATPase assembly integral membrane protein VMA21 homolog [Paramacrobiotus metropolitanus]XP_055333256.1 vacuolar ATPase assembly integral membrane protein VMA21 homolog [Paramacrobiotus metropolitanus]
MSTSHTPRPVLKSRPEENDDKPRSESPDKARSESPSKAKTGSPVKERKPRSGSPVKQPKELSSVSDDEVSSIFKNLTTYTLLIVFLPIASYFGAKKVIFEQYLGIASGQSAIYWAVLAVASIHVVLGIMVYRAYREGIKPRNIKQD